jgi:hypothetical protein
MGITTSNPGAAAEEKDDPMLAPPGLVEVVQWGASTMFLPCSATAVGKHESSRSLRVVTERRDRHWQEESSVDEALAGRVR